MKKILVPTDFSEYAYYALKVAAQIAKKNNGEIILLQGVNGSGKTSILEALHYGSNLRSFRTRIPKELIKFGTDCFFKGIRNLK